MSEYDPDPSTFLYRLKQSAESGYKLSDKSIKALDEIIKKQSEEFLKDHEEVINFLKDYLPPDIYLSADEEFMTTQLMTALASYAGGAFNMNNSIVTIHDGTPMSMSESNIKEALSSVVNFLKPKGDDTFTRIRIPTDVARMVKESKQKTILPRLKGISTVPIMKPDGNIVTTPGYNEDTELYYIPYYEYPEEGRNVKHAVDILTEPLCDFPFASEIDISRVMAAMMSVAFRNLYNLPPMFPIRANTPGSGKTHLMKCISIVSTGYEASYHSMPYQDDEMDKRLASIAESKQRIACFDNISRSLGNDPLAKVLTGGGKYRTRRLHTLTDVEYDFDAVLFATGNNMRFRLDMPRRVVPITLSPMQSNPGSRRPEDFSYPNFIEYMKEKHPEMLMALMTIMQKYIKDGKPRVNREEHLGGFEEWCDTIQSAIIYAGLPDPLTGIYDESMVDDEDADALRDLLSSWYRCFPEKEKTLREAFEYIDGMAYQKDQNAADLYVALKAFDKKQGSAPNIRSIGQNIPATSTGSRIIDGLRMYATRDHNGTKSYVVRRMKSVEYI